MIAPEDQIRVTAETSHRDYILTDYSLKVDPIGRLQPVSLFRHELRAAGWFDAVWPLCEALIEAVGPDNTVWALKYGADGIGVEFYLYNNRANDPVGPLSVGPVAKALEGLGQFPQLCEERIPYFMWSFEVTPEGLDEGCFEPIRLYVGTGEELRTPAGFSYRLEDGGSFLENHYAFYRPNKDLADVMARVQMSVRSGRAGAQKGLIPKYLMDCFTICYAVKPQRDGVYFARISSTQLSRFMRQARKTGLADLLDAHAEDFEHCVWDLGCDFRMPESATRTAIEKMAFHGVF